MQGLAELINHRAPEFLASAEATVCVRPDIYLMPDVIVQRRNGRQAPDPEAPVQCCVEILSPADMFSEALSRGENYHASGIETVWLIDPAERRAWEFRKGRRLIEVPATGALTAEGISVSLKDLFEVL